MRFLRCARIGRAARQGQGQVCVRLRLIQQQLSALAILVVDRSLSQCELVIRHFEMKLGLGRVLRSRLLRGTHGGFRVRQLVQGHGCAATGGEARQ